MAKNSSRAALARVGGGPKSVCKRFLPVFLTILGHFDVFCALWCILVKTQSFLGAPVSGQLQLPWHQKGLGNPIWGHILTANSLGDTNMHSLGCLRGLLGSVYPRIPICLSLVGAPKMTVFESKMHQNARNTLK